MPRITIDEHGGDLHNCAQPLPHRWTCDGLGMS